MGNISTEISPKKAWLETENCKGGSIEECTNCEVEVEVPAEGGQCEDCGDWVVPCHACPVWDKQGDCEFSDKGCKFFNFDSTLTQC